MNSIASPLDALHEALARIVANERRQWQRDRELMASEYARSLAQVEARLAQIELKAVERMAAVKNGTEGPPGAQGPVGELGPQGERGADGAAGPQGEPGPAGPQGERGIDGLPGIDGTNGIQGVPGPQGERGTDGEAGPQGERGTDGEAGPQGERGAPGERGADGIGFTVRGTYSAESEYASGDIVMLGGSSFVALEDSPGNCPGAGWQLWASAGRRGEKGERGIPGPRGEAGAPGATLIGGSFNAKDMKLVLMRDDGETVTVDAYEFAEAIRSA